MLDYSTALATSNTAVIVSYRICVPNGIIAVTDCFLIVSIKRITAGKTSFLCITAVLTGRSYRNGHVCMIDLRKCNCVFIITVDTSVLNESALRAGCILLILECVVVSCCAYNSLITEFTGRTLILDHAVGSTIVFGNNGRMPFVTERRYLRAFYLLSATDTDAISTRCTGSGNCVYVC